MSIQLDLTLEPAREPYQDPERLRSLYHDRGLSLRAIADELGCHYTTVHEYMARFGIERRAASHDPDPDGHAAFVHHSRGYEAWVDRSRLALVHRLVAVAERGFDAVADGVVHHENGIPWDNRPSNLTVFDSAAEHTREHARPDPEPAQARLADPE